MSSAPASPGPQPEPESRNELRAERYAWFRTTDRRTARSMLTELQTHGIAAYFAPAEDAADGALAVEVWVDQAEHQQAESISGRLDETPGRRELNGDEVDARFAELIAQFHEPSDVPDLVEAEPEPAERRGPRDPADDAPQWRGADGSMLDETPEDEDDHYEPPPPQPLPRLSNRSWLAISVLAAGCVLLFFPTLLGFGGTSAVVGGVALITIGVGLLLVQLRDGPDDPTDDGARI
ncbi:hypothetical protein EK0264_02010 [Epidermidibacterium keratini]|uniref:DUF308 domain-containing protein n=1 Tax=Epidermidibacterium keratini TaxID=1891644 RepID=A0A7L4YJ92_9ACTN|nr:hypothetical protein [Epidermidibacterium keratini]QHB99181.1 hypothetical protein EK0264_02010 [Epidermidibacterium keratini]